MKSYFSEKSMVHYTGVLLLLFVLLPYFISFDYLLLQSNGFFIKKEFEIVLFCLMAHFYFNKKGLFGKAFIPATLVALGLGIASWILCAVVYDFSFDGQGYHQDAIISISNGWNFIFDSASNSFHERWIDYYPKAGWLTQSFYYNLTGSLEASKFTNLLLILSSIFLSIDFLKSIGFNSKIKISCIALAMGFDPINLNSFFSFMNDGQVSSMLLILFLLLSYHRKRPSDYSLFIIALSIVYLVNIKFNAGVYGMMLCAGFLVYDIYKKAIRINLKTHILLALTFLLAYFLWGFNPHSTNYRDKDHIFYPLLTSQNTGQSELGADYLPSNFSLKPNPEKLALSILAETSFSKSFQKRSRLKIPFTFSLDELKTYAATGVMLGGLGPLFSALLLLCIFFLIIHLCLLFKHSSLKIGFGLIIGIILLSTIPNPMAWWFRFVPQLWFIVIAAIICFQLDESKLLKRGSNLILVVAMINLCLMGAYVLYQPYKTYNLNKELSIIQDQSVDKEILISFGQHKLSFQRKLQKHSISYIEQEFNPQECQIFKDFKLIEAKLCIK